MARTGDSLGYYYEEGYIDEGYIRYEPYIEDGYITDDYFQGEGVVLEGAATLSVSVTVEANVGKITQGNVILSGVFSPSIQINATRAGDIDLYSFVSFDSTASRIRDNDVALSNLVNLSLQAAKTTDTSSDLFSAFAQTSTASRTRDYDSSLAVSADISSTPTRIKQLEASITGAFTTNVFAVASLNGSTDFAVQATSTIIGNAVRDANATLASAFSVSADVERPVEFASTMSAAATLTATPIEYIGKTYNYNRPHDFVTFAGTSSRDTSIYKWGSSSVKLGAGGSSGSGTWYTDSSNPVPVIDSNTDFAFELYYYIDSDDIISTGSANIFEIGGILRIPQSYTAELEPTITLEKSDSSNITFSAGGDITFNNQWNHIAIKRTNGIITAYVNGSQFGNSASYSGQIGYGDATPGIANGQIVIQDNPGISAIRFDSISLIVNDDTIYGPSNPPVNSYDNTVFYYPFEADGFTYNQDYLGITLEASATLSGAASFSVTATETQSAEAILSTTASLSATIGKINSATATVDAQAALTGTATRIKPLAATITALYSTLIAAGRVSDFFIDCESVVSLNTDVNKIASANSSLAASVTLNADVARIRDTAASTTSAFTISAEATEYQGIPSTTLSSVATISADPTKIHPGNAALSSQFSLSASGDKTVAFIVDAAAQTTVDATALRIKQLAASISALYSTLTAAAKVGDFLVAMDNTTALTVDAVKYAENETDFVVSTAFEVDALAFKPSSATLTSAFTQTTNAIKAVEAQATISAAASFSIQANITAKADIELDANFAQTSNVNVITDTSSNNVVTASANITGNAVRDADAAFATAFTLTANGGALYQGQASIDSALSFSVDFRILHLQQYVYVVPRETRTFTIDSENRSHSIHKETRIYTIRG